MSVAIRDLVRGVNDVHVIVVNAGEELQCAGDGSNAGTRRGLRYGRRFDARRGPMGS